VADGTLAILGAGTMGTGLAALAIGHGVPVVLVDTDSAAVDRAPAAVRLHLRTAQLLGGLAVPDGAEDLLRTTTDPAQMAGAGAVVECVTEVADLKRGLLRTTADVVGRDAVLMTNTSAITVDELADALADPTLLVGAHFMNPPYLIEGVEVVRGPRTAPAVLAAAGTLLRKLGRRPVVVGDGPGFVINRILQRMINDAATVVEQGLATPEAVDELFTRCLGHRTGPLATADLIGLDNVVDTLRVLHERTRQDGYQPCQLLLDKVERGDLGRKSGTGFFTYRTTEGP
jgi:methoxymalonate biosynthesis protein